MVLFAAAEVFEKYTSSTGDPLAYMSKYNSTMFWNILHTAPINASAIQSAVSLSKTRNVGHIYITNDIMPDPYHHAPNTTVIWPTEKTAAATEDLLGAF